MFLDPKELEAAQIEDVERASARLITQAIYEFRETAADIFATEEDLAQDIAEDVTREALDRVGVSRMDLRLYGKIDYKRARYVFHPEYAVRQALFVDSKAEKEHGTSTIQIAQTSMRIRHLRAGRPVDVPGGLATCIGNCLCTTILVKYEYEDDPENRLREITIAALPSGLLQDRYNPSATDTIWRTGRNAPSLGEPFRARLVVAALKSKMKWRVQAIPVGPDAPPPLPSSFPWDE